MASLNDDNDKTGDTKKAKLPKIDGSETVGKTKWLQLNTLSYTDQEGNSRKWDYATRTTKKSADSADAVIIIPLLKRYGKDNNDDDDSSDDKTLETILVEQFRPPVGQATLEFPAGLIDHGETAEQAALRELREETGYVGEACKTPPTVSRQVCMSPGLCDETVQVVVCIVDLENPYNQNPQPEPDAGEFIKIHRVSLRDGFQTLLDKSSSPMAIQGLYLFALGLELGKSMNRKK